jgi:hypothetical protein
MGNSFKFGTLRTLLLALGLLISVNAFGILSSPHDAFSRRFEWTFRGDTYTLDYSFPWATYHFYQEKPRIFFNYAVYTFEHPRHRFLADFTEQLVCVGEEAGLDKPTTLEMVIAFVQALEYQSEVGEYPKFPVETLSEKGGDCEDTAILLAAILKEMGYETIFVNPPGHMAIALACEDCGGTAYNQDGRRYYYVETTSSGFGIGEIPPDYAETRDKLLPMSAKPEELWVLREFVPRRSGPAGMVYFVSEDADARLAKSQQGDVLATTTITTVEVDGKVSQSRKIELKARD